MTISTSSTAGLYNGECVDLAGGVGSEKLDDLGPVNPTFLESVRDGGLVAAPADDSSDSVGQRHGVDLGSIAEHGQSQADSSSLRSFGSGPAGLVASGDGSRQLDSSILIAGISVASADGVETCAWDALCGVHVATPVEDEPEIFRRVKKEEEPGKLPFRRAESGDAFWRAPGTHVDEAVHEFKDGPLGEESERIHKSDDSRGTLSTVTQTTSTAPSSKNIKRKYRKVAPAEDEPAKPPFHRIGGGEDFWRALGARADEEIDGFNDDLFGEKHDEFRGSFSTFEQASAASKYKYWKVMMMALCIWSITGALLSMAFGLEWYNHEGNYTDGDLCTLCGKNRIDFVIDKMSSFPTRQPTPPPSTPEVTTPLNTIDLPPTNLAKLCATSLSEDQKTLFIECTYPAQG